MNQHTQNNITSLASTHITYEFTKDALLLEQYYKIREVCYRLDLGIVDFSGAEDEYDKIGYIVIARVGDEVIGGARLVISEPGNHRVMLPLEEDNFKVCNLFPELNLDMKSYCEVTRVAIIPEFREGEVNKELTSIMLGLAKYKHCDYHFSLAPIRQARNARIISRKLGLEHIIRTDITVPYKPVYEHLNEQQICLSVTNLHNELIKKISSLQEHALELH